MGESTFFAVLLCVQMLHTLLDKMLQKRSGSLLVACVWDTWLCFAYVYVCEMWW